MMNEELRYFIDRIDSIILNMIIFDKEKNEPIAKKVKLRQLWNPSIKAEMENLDIMISGDGQFTVDNFTLTLDSALVSANTIEDEENNVTLDETIAKYKDKSKFYKETTNIAYGLELEQIAAWLEELKELKQEK